MALEPTGTRGMLTLNGVDPVQFVADIKAIQVATENVIVEQDGLALQAAKDDAATKYGGTAADLDASMRGRHLAPDEHLDTVQGIGRFYVDTDAEAPLSLGFPVAKAGTGEVRRWNTSGTALIQTWIPFRHDGWFMRFFYLGEPYTSPGAGSGWMEFPNKKAIDLLLAGKADASSVPAARSSTTSVAAIGDSLTRGYSNGATWADADAYPAKLGAALGAGITVTNRGFSGATTDQINARVGALPIYFTVVGGVIPESGTVNLTSEQVIGAWGGAVDFNMYGYLNDVYGLLQYTQAGGYTFLRSGSGAAVTTAKATLLGEFKQHAADTVIYMAGRNDITKGTTGMEETIADHVIRGNVEMAEYLTPRRKQFVLAGTVMRTDETPGSAGYLAVQEISTRLRQLYPANFVDVQGYLTGPQVWTNTGITPTQADLDAQALGMSPPSLFDDVTHYSRATAAAIAEHLFAPYLTQRGWV